MDAELIPITSLRQLATAEGACTRCPLYKDATQAVPGEGPSRATFMLVGEQPGDREDLAGKPFVGPEGRMLDQALADAGIARDTVRHRTSVITATHRGREGQARGVSAVRGGSEKGGGGRLSGSPNAAARRSEKAVDRNGKPCFRTNQHVKGVTASRRAEGAPLTC